MKLMLFSQTKATEFFLPNQVSGSYSFSEKQSDEQKLMQVEALDNKWILSPIDDSLLIYNNEYKDSIDLIENEFYVLKRDGETYLLFACSSFEAGYKIYSFDDKIDLLIGSHIQYNHVQEHGPIIDTFSVSKAIYSIDIKNCKKNKLCDSDDIKYVLDSINKKNIPVEVKYPGDVMQVGDMMAFIQYAMQIVLSFLMISMIFLSMVLSNKIQDFCMCLNIYHNMSILMHSLEV